MSDKSPVLAIDARLYGNRSWAWRIATATVDRFVADYQDSYSKIVLIAHSRKVYDALPSWGNVKKVFISSHFLLGKLVLTPFWLMAHKVKVYFSPTSDLPLWKPSGIRYVNMIHDLFMELILDELVGKGRWFRIAFKDFLSSRDFQRFYYLAGLFSRAFSISDRTVAISNFSKSQLVDLYHVEPNKIDVVYIAAWEEFFSPYSKDSVRISISEKYWIDGNYFFSYDATADYFSLAEVLGSRDVFKWFKWVILNRYPETVANLKPYIDCWDVFVIQDYVSDEDLIALIRGSEFVFFPSVWEGFWLPIAESLASWKYVLLPDSTAMPEVGWDFVFTYDPSSDEDLSSKFASIAASYRSLPDPSKTCFVRRYSWNSFTDSLSYCLIDLLN